MVFYCAALSPLELFGEPDPETAPRARLDDTAVLSILTELGPWAKVKRHDQPEPAQTGWVLKDKLIAIEDTGLQPLVLHAEPFGENPLTLDGRILRKLIEIAPWRKVLVQRADGSTVSGWIEVKTPGAIPSASGQDGLELGVNEVFRDALLKARAATGIDAAALAAMIDAEASTIRIGPQKGQWDPKAFNGSSGAAGLTQFLASTWQGHAKLAGTELRRFATREGLVDAAGVVVPGREQDLLDLRFNPTLSILSAAEYGAANLKGLISRGLVGAAEPDDRKAWFMYLAHHEGLGGASGFLDGTRVYSLANLEGQLGGARAKALLDEHGGDANQAYRQWLKGYIDLKIRPSKFRKPGTAPAGTGTSPAIPQPGMPSPGMPSPGMPASAAFPEELRAYAGLSTGASAILRNFVGPALSLPAIGGDLALAKAVQEALSCHGYLDPPADGEFGPVSLWALGQFIQRAGSAIENGFTPELAALLADPARALAEIRPTGGWFDKVVRFMRQNDYFICRHPACCNIVYIEGMDIHGVPNADRPNEFNDLRLVFRLSEAGLPEIQAWEATTEPGNFWTQSPMNPAGAARIAFRQFKSWAVGKHLANKASGHEALVQVKPVTVHRDFNKDHTRRGDTLDRGIFGINQHWGYDAPVNDVQDTSAGCLVGRTKEGHRAFMALVKTDARYQASKAYRFVTAIIPADQLGP